MPGSRTDRQFAAGNFSGLVGLSQFFFLCLFYGYGVITRQDSSRNRSNPNLRTVLDGRTTSFPQHLEDRNYSAESGHR